MEMNYRISRFAIFVYLPMGRLAEMRPQDVVILLYLASRGRDQAPIRQLEIAYNLKISQSEVSASLQRSLVAGLLSKDRQTVLVRALLGFLEHGLRYVFPAVPGSMAVGVPCAHADPVFANEIISDEAYVWPYADGHRRGFSIQPLISSVPQTALKDAELSGLLSACEMIRVGRVRESQRGIEYLKDRLIKRSTHYAGN